MAGCEQQVARSGRAGSACASTSKGAGPAVVFFHGPVGPHVGSVPRRAGPAASPSTRRSIPAPRPGDPDAIQHLDGLWDLVLCYDELLEQLGLASAMLVGHSFGAMVACEVAARLPGARPAAWCSSIRIGLWRDDAPVLNWMLLDPQELPAHVFHDPDGARGAAHVRACPTTRRRASLAQDAPHVGHGRDRQVHLADPRQGAEEAHPPRHARPTLLVWGEEDRLVPPVYAEEFARRIADARSRWWPDAGHAPHLEQPDATARAVQAFLKA